MDKGDAMDLSWIESLMSNGGGIEAELLPKIIWTTDDNAVLSLNLQLIPTNSTEQKKAKVDEMDSFDYESMNNPNSVSEKVADMLHYNIGIWYPHRSRAVKLTEMFLEGHDEEEVVKYLGRHERLRKKLGLFDRLLDTEDKAANGPISSFIDSEFTTYYGCKSTHFPLQSDSTWTVHQGFSIDISGCCGASCYARESAIYRSYGDCILYCRKREFFQTGCGMMRYRGGREREPTKSMDTFMGILLTPKLIAQRVIGSSDGVWDEITKIIYRYCPLAIFSEMDQGKVKTKKDKWTKALIQVQREHFQHSQFGFPDSANWDSILAFGRDSDNLGMSGMGMGNMYQMNQMNQMNAMGMRNGQMNMGMSGMGMSGMGMGSMGNKGSSTMSMWGTNITSNTMPVQKPASTGGVTTVSTNQDLFSDFKIQ